MKICLIRCPSPFLIDERVFPPLGLMAVGTTLKIKGHDVTIYDGDINDFPMDFEYYGLGPTTPEYPYALKVKEKIGPRAKIVVGGPHATLNPRVCLDDGFDCIVCGDGEMSVERAFKSDIPLIISKELPLDEYPIIDRTILNLKNYKYLLNGRLATTMMTSQGCPFKCGFCAKNYRTVRFRSIENVIKEIDILHFDFGYDALAFPEDMFILIKERTEKICVHLKKLGMIWRCLIRADFVVKYGNVFIKTMADSGCVEIGMGVESGSDKILSIVNKGETVETIKTAIKMLKDSGIRIKGYFIVGLPGETQSTLDETRMFLEEMNFDDVDIKIYQPFPGTPIWNNRNSYDIQWDDIDFIKMFYKGRPKEYYGNVRTSSLTNQQIYNTWVEMEEKYKCHEGFISHNTGT